MSEAPTPQEQVRRLYEEGESRAAEAAEQLVGRESFGELLARMTENVMSLARIGNDVLDLAVRNLRVAGRQDLNRLGRQLARTEDKLEMVLQEVERLEERLDAQARASADAAQGTGGAKRSGARGRSARSKTATSKSSSSRSKSSSDGAGGGSRRAGSGRRSRSRS